MLDMRPAPLRTAPSSFRRALALAPVLGGVLLPFAQVHAQAITQVLTGTDGRAGKASVLGFGGYDPTDGTTTGSVSVTNSRDIGSTSGAAITAGSQGGSGGAGASGFTSHQFGGSGGSAGAVMVIDTGNLTGQGDQTVTAGANNGRSGVAVLKAFSYGGKGGPGPDNFGAAGSAGAVTVTLGATIMASGNNLAALFAASEGGAAGGGGGVQKTLIGVRTGGNAGDVSVRLQPGGAVSTTGSGSAGLIVQSIGGHGGNRDKYYLNGYPYVSNGGAAGDVVAVVDGDIKTAGNASTGALLESVGGGGGISTVGILTATDGAQGGAAGTVTGTFNGGVATRGSYSYGIIAQSVGGAGGGGGSPSLGSGANGGNAAAGGTVTITETGSVATSGDHSTGILAQSIGGGSAAEAFPTGTSTTGTVTGGGNGGSGQLALLVSAGSGGNGGRGGNGGTVLVNNSGTIVTAGDDSAGIVAQSVGGGGGGGGSTNTLGILFAVALGAGDGGTGGAGGAVTVQNQPDGNATAGAITTSGAFSPGILAQSVGGGGGVGGSSRALAAGPALSVAYALGGNGGSGGTGGTMTVVNDLPVMTFGAYSPAILAMSLGGGGGTAGSAAAYSLAIGVDKKVPTLNIGAATGGSGGSGNSGGAVTLTNTSLVSTSGDSSPGILAQSIGGGGGSGGSAFVGAWSAPVTSKATIKLIRAVGGNGGSGNTGGSVEVTNSGSITTSRDNSDAISAQSIGGGGGNGGTASFSSGVIANLGTTVEASVTSRVGGSGGTGNSGGNLEVTNTGDVSAQGASSSGISAISIGGGGGDGGSSLASPNLGSVGNLLQVNTTTKTALTNGLQAGLNNLSLSDLIDLTNDQGKSTSLAFNRSVGGDAGTGGAGGAVTVTNSGRIEMFGDQAYGIEAASIGGGGGLGGSATSDLKTNVTINTAVGGSGKSGNTGGDVTVTNAAGGRIETVGSDSDGIFAQSVGGGGGMGGGGSSTAGTDAAATVKKVFGKVLSKADLPDYALFDAATGQPLEGDKLKKALQADAGRLIKLVTADVTKWLTGNQSGSSGSSKQPFQYDPKKFEIPISLSANSSVGGSGGSGANGGSITVTNNGSITTAGEGASAIYAQSIGGGGGSSGDTTVASDRLVSLRLATGGSGGAGGSGGGVTATNSGSIETDGAASFGIFGQSVGAGGGEAKMSVDATKNALAQPYAWPIIESGTGGASGQGGAVTLTNSGGIVTAGAQSSALVAQSLGGGGGQTTLDVFNPGAYLALVEQLRQTGTDLSGLDLEDTVAQAQTALAAQHGQTLSYTLTLGSQGNGNGGATAVNQNGVLATAGRDAFGILAQSVGGGGGIVIDGEGGGYTSPTISGQMGGGRGNGGNISIVLGNGSRISTTGTGSAGILAQSIGGGGGYVGILDAPSAFYSSLLTTLGTGDGHDVSVKTSAGASADIITAAANASGIFAQSLGGGGGAIGANDGLAVPQSIGTSRGNTSARGGAITIDYAGSILATGAGSDAIFAQSGVQGTGGLTVPQTAAEQIAVTVRDGTITGGSGPGVGIQLDGGLDNSITVGAGATVTASSGTAIQTDWGNTAVTIGGTVIGNMLVSGGVGSQAVTVNPGGLLESGGQLALGTAGRLLNAGSLNIGGTNHIITTALTGGFLNAGTLAVDENFATGQGDLLKVTGSVSMAGNVGVNLMGLPSVFNPAAMPVVSVVSGSAMSSSQASVNPSVVLSYRLVPTAPATIGVQIAQADFMPASVASLPEATDNVKSVAEAYQNAWNNGDLGDQSEQFVHLAQISDPKTYVAELGDATNEEAAVPAATTIYEAQAFQNTLHSCPVFVEDTTNLNEQDCVYLRNFGSAAHLSANAGMSGFHSSGYALELGGEKQFAPGWFVGGAIAPGQSWSSNSSGNSQVSSDTLDMGAVIKHFVTPQLLLAGSLSYGNQSSTLTDVVEDSFYGPLVSTAQQEINRMTARFRAEYDIPFRTWYLRPMMDTDVTYTHMSSYTETGAQLFDVSYKATDKAVPDLSPTLEIGKRLDGRNVVTRLYADLGMTWFVNPNWQQEGNFVGLPDASFNTYSAVPALLGRVAVGVQIYAWHNISAQMEFDGSYSPSYTENGGTFRLDYRF